LDARDVIGWNLRRLRLERRLSQERLALAFGIDRAYVGRVERGSENVTIAALEAFATALEVPIAVMLTEPQADAARPTTLKAGRKPKG
jgi:transcriptional regulator with XRE-family HTH domain